MVTDVATFLEQLGGFCFAAAELVLNPIAPPSEPESDKQSPWVMDRDIWILERGTEEPIAWVADTTLTYVVEAAHQVRACGVLLRTQSVTASLDPLVRAVVERSGRVKWILSPNLYPDQRGARAGLEVGVSMAAYRLTLDRLRAPGDVCKEWQKRVRAHRVRLEQLFTVEKPPADPCDPKSPPSEDMSQWTVQGERYPNYGTNAGFALETESTTHIEGKATYDGLSGFSHPSVVFSREHRAVGEDGRVTYTYQMDDLERAARLAGFGLLDCFRYWTTYYGAEPEAVQERIDQLGDTMNEISVIGRP